jgi:hypothetical protein
VAEVSSGLGSTRSPPQNIIKDKDREEICRGKERKRVKRDEICRGKEREIVKQTKVDGKGIREEPFAGTICQRLNVSPIVLRANTSVYLKIFLCKGRTSASISCQQQSTD